MNKIKIEHEIVKAEICEAYENDKLIPFIGAGFSKNIKGYPDWREFIEELGKDISINLHHYFKENFLEATEHYVWEKGKMQRDQGVIEPKNEQEREAVFKKGKESLLTIIKDMVNKHPRTYYDKTDWICHDTLVTKFDYIYTTNWDNTLELSKPETSTKPISIFTKSHLGTLDALRGSKELNKYRRENLEKCEKIIKIIKFHGHYENINAESLIACQSDYNRRILEENPFDIKFKHDLLHYNFFFIGYNFGDPNISLMIQLISGMKKEILPGLKTTIFWLSAENFNDPRVRMIKDSLEVKVCHLLDKKKQEDLEKCKTWEPALQDKKQKYLRQSILEFLDNFKEE